MNLKTGKQQAENIAKACKWVRTHKEARLLVCGWLDFSEELFRVSAGDLIKEASDRFKINERLLYKILQKEL